MVHYVNVGTTRLQSGMINDCCGLHGISGFILSDRYNRGATYYGFKTQKDYLLKCEDAIRDLCLRPTTLAGDGPEKREKLFKKKKEEGRLVNHMITLNCLQEELLGKTLRDLGFKKAFIFTNPKTDRSIHNYILYGDEKC